MARKFAELRAGMSADRRARVAARTAVARKPSHERSYHPVMPNTTHARGTFDVAPKVISSPDEAPLGRMSIDKTFHGDLDASTRGQMLSAMTATKGSAGYVAIELVTGTLAGKTGTFLLQHHGLMNRGVPTISVTVIPDSGTGELVGLSGTLAIIMADGKHGYDFEYSIGT